MLNDLNPQDKPTIPRVVTTSFGIRRLSTLAQLLKADIHYRPSFCPKFLIPSSSTVICWGKKTSARMAESLAKRTVSPLMRLEDGFVRSMGLGFNEPPLSIVIDRRGIYYDATCDSSLEQYIQEPLTEHECQRAHQLIRHWQITKVSKYNHNRMDVKALPSQFVLLVDQTKNDASIEFGLASAESFSQMLATAMSLFPNSPLVLKVHPDVMAGKKQGHFDIESLQQQGVLILSEDIHPSALLPHSVAVFCVTSQLGFEALMWGKPVYTFGMPFYAGWGLTYDACKPLTVRTKATLEQLVFAALVKYPVYIHPDSGMHCPPEMLMSWIAYQRNAYVHLPNELWVAGFSVWKRYLLKRFLPRHKLHFVKHPSQVPSEKRWLCWGSRFIDYPGAIRVEDGFIRSKGLGVALNRPLSWVFDPDGIYYDCSAPSRLEKILNSTTFNKSQLEDAAALCQAIVSKRITKYNIGQASWQPPSGKTIVLVPGQVETDASIRYGSPEVKSNLELLIRVKHETPTAYIIYKPHPDVQAGMRKAGSTEHLVHQYCDEIVTSEDMAYLLDLVDEVHTMTSLTGFEALMRGKKVVCYGLPFYAGWGLTDDKLLLPRRQRKLELNELIAGTLLCYPNYFHPSSHSATDANTVVQYLIDIKNKEQKPVSVLRRLLNIYLRWQKF